MSKHIVALTHAGQVRTINEDCVLAKQLLDCSCLLAVADGVGGLSGGEIASSQAVETLQQELSQSVVNDPAAALMRAFARANERVLLLGSRRRGLIATTLVAAFVRGDQVWLANVGDSRAYLFESGRLKQLTQDHSVVAEQVRAGILSAEEGEHSDYRNVITRGIGVEDSVEADGVGPVQLSRGSTLLLCSDGLHGVVPEDQIATLLSLGTADVMARGLIDASNQAGGPDNVSVVLFQG